MIFPLFRKNLIDVHIDVCVFVVTGETYKGFHYGYWAFSRTPITQSLTKVPDAEEQISLSVFQLILTYAGLGQNGDTVRRVEDEHVNLIQTVMDRCMRKDILLNELYLQLIKQTTDHPDPNSRVNLRHWALLSLGKLNTSAYICLEFL